MLGGLAERLSVMVTTARLSVSVQVVTLEATLRVT